MESKIIQVINKMIEKSHLINNVMQNIRDKGEFFFVYNQKYKWSIKFKKDDQTEIFLYYYTDDYAIEYLSGASADDINYITYKVSDFKSQEAFESFQELFNIVKTKLLGIDKVLDDILSEGP